MMNSYRSPPMQVLTQQLVDAVGTDNDNNNLERLRECTRNLFALVKDNDINNNNNNPELFAETTNQAIQLALFQAARVRRGGGPNHATFLFLFSNLSEYGKSCISEWTDNDAFRRSLLHLAVHFDKQETVQFLVNECNNCNINYMDCDGRTPLHYAVTRRYYGPTATTLHEVTRFLLDAGADFNLVDKNGNCPLYCAVDKNCTSAALLLLLRGANPNLNRKLANEEENDSKQQEKRRITDLAISRGNEELVHVLIEHHGAFVGSARGCYNPERGTSLNELLNDGRGRPWWPLQTRETKLAICRILVGRAPVDINIAEFLHSSLVHEIKKTDSNNNNKFGNIEILLEAGVTPTSQTLNHAVREGKHKSLCQLLIAHGANPFLEVVLLEESNDDKNVSPFQTAAQMENTDIFEYFLSLWDEAFPSNNGKNDNDEYPIHAICRIKNVSLSIIKRLLAMDCRQALYALEKHNGLFPFHIASKANVSVDVIYTLFQHCADAFVQTIPTHHCRHEPIIMAHQEPQSQQDQEPQTATAANEDEDDIGKNNDNNAASLSSTVVAGRARKRARR